jgi:hypothetical protein
LRKIFFSQNNRPKELVMKNLILFLSFTWAFSVMSQINRPSKPIPRPHVPSSPVIIEHPGNPGRISLPQGRSTVQIRVGSRDQHQQQFLIQRILLLEEAVQDLQDIVYTLILRGQGGSFPSHQQTKYFCHITSSWNRTFFGEGFTLAEAKNITFQQCINKEQNSMYCQFDRMECQY